MAHCSLRQASAGSRTLAALAVVLGALSSSCAASAADYAVRKGDCTFVPARCVAAVGGAELGFSDGVFTLKTPARHLKLEIGKKRAFRDGKAVVLDGAPFILAGTGYVPARFAAGGLGVELGYDATQRLVSLAYKGRRASLPLLPPRGVEIRSHRDLAAFMREVEKAFRQKDLETIVAAMIVPLRYYDDGHISGARLRKEIRGLFYGKFAFSPPTRNDSPYGGYGCASPQDYYSIAGDRSVPDEGGETGFMGTFIFHRVDGYWRIAAIQDV